jgi:hypothetical protein
MLFRAIFWIGLVSLLMPRERDMGPERMFGIFGYGEHSQQNSYAPGSSAGNCPDRQTFCSVTAMTAETLQSEILNDLARVKNDIETQEHARSP